MRFRRLDGAEFRDALGAVRPPTVLDVRSAAAFAAGHVPGSLHLPVHDLPARRRELPSSLIERILIVADTQKRAEAAANFVALVGYGDVAVLDGGIAAFEGSLDVGPPAPPRRHGPELRVVPSEAPPDAPSGSAEGE